MYSKTTLLALLLVLVLVARGVYNVSQKESETRLEVVRAEKQKAELQGRYSAIRDSSDQLKSSAGIEAEIRSKFDVVKEGEGVIVIVDKDLPVIEEDKRGALKKFWDSVIGVFKGEGEATSTRAQVGR